MSEFESRVTTGSDKNNFIPERLKEAREARGYSMAELAKKIGVTRQAISKYELGNAKPSNLFSLARSLNFPVAFFSLEVQTQHKPVSAIYFRKLKSADLRARGLCRARAHWLTQIFSTLEEHVEFPEVLLPDLPEAGGVWENEDYSDEQIEQAAYLCRKLWKIPDGPLTDISLACENNGVIISQIKLGVPNIDAFSLWYSDRPVIFLASDKGSAVRSRFDTAHEMGHLILHPGVSEDDINDPNILRRIELEANKFAAALLLPKETFKAEFISTRMDHLIEMKRHWKVSMAALVFRARELEIISSDEALNIRKRLSAYGYRQSEPLDDEILFEEPRLLRRAMALCIESGVFTRDEIFQRFRLPSEEVEKLCFLPEGFLSPNNVMDFEVRLRSSG